MTTLFGGFVTELIKRPLCLSEREVAFARRGFHRGAEARVEHLEAIGRSFLMGFNAVMRNDVDGALVALGGVPAVDRGFASEGLAMGLGLLDLLVPGRRRDGGRWRTAVERLDGAHGYMMAIGFGLALARLKRPVDLTSTSKIELDPVEAALAADGYGFHHGFFTRCSDPAIRGVPGKVTPAARPSFDQGLGRSLWFMQCADAGRMGDFIESLDRGRHGDVWSGVGLAAAYAGGLTRSELEALQERAGPWRAELAQGAACAALARSDAGNGAARTELACEVFWDGAAEEIAGLMRAQRPDARDEGPRTYGVWCARMRASARGRELAR